MTEKKHKCQYCGKTFSRESTLISHMCEKKRRWLQRDDRSIQIAYMAWKRFMDLHGPKRKNPYTYEDFMHSQLYLGFVRFGRHVQKLKPVDTQDYIDFLIENGVKLDDWIKDWPYEMYMKEKAAKEHPERALERSLLLIEEWAIANDDKLENFFQNINPNQAVHWIQNGKLSPWLLYCASTSDKLFEHMSEEQIQMIHDQIDPKRWKARLKKYSEETQKIQEVLREYGV